MSLLPALPQPARGRSDAAPAITPERRPVDATRDRFAASLATARDDRTSTNDRAPSRTDRAARSDAAPESEEYAAAKLRVVAQQRAQLQALMLTGAMKFAVTRNDAAVATLPGVVASQPDVTCIADGDATPMDSGPLAAALDMGVSAQTLSGTVAPTMSQVLDASALQNMPAMVTLATSGLTDVSEVEVNSVDARTVDASGIDTDDATDAAPDLSTMNGATAAAMQLVASMPIAIAAPDVAAEYCAADVTDQPSGTGETTASFDGTASSQPDRVDRALVEDHFDAPASVLDSVLSDGTPARATTAAVRSATTAGSIDGSGASTSATDAAGATARASAAATAADVTQVQTDIAKLDPEFRERLQKVIDRMRQEFGHAVTVVETVRSQARQDALFAQGRTEPGPVVTWTRNSKHGKGLAADLMVDGAWQNPVGYAHLAAIAKDEGLRTLGARDAGHVELPADAGVSAETLGNLLNDLQGDAGDGARQLRGEVRTGGGDDSASRAGMMARVANVAQVARVASVANVAQLARVASVARPGAAAPQVASDVVSPLAVSAVPAITSGSDTSNVMRASTPVSGVNMADRITHLLDLQATQSAKPLNSVLLRMENANGIEDQIRIDTRGTSVDARLGLGNAQQAAALTDRLGELRDALERRGLTADGVRVQAAAPARGVDSTTFARPVAATIELAAMRASADAQAQGNTRDQNTRDQAQREAFARDQSRNTPRPSSDDARQRSRREQPEERR